MDRICIESDSKTCVDHIRGVVRNFPWRVSHLLADLLALASNHPRWSFAWVNRKANRTSHELVGWSLRNRFWGSFDIRSGPFCFVNACSVDQLVDLSLPL